MSQSSPERDPLSPDEALPPVEPPSAGFLIQLFVVPGVIVLVIVLVWLLFTMVARKTDDPQKYVHQLQRSGPSQWQAAWNLAEVLRDERQEEFKRNSKVAGQLATMLSEQLKIPLPAGKDKERARENPINLRMYLCRVLGEFYVDDGLEVLLEAATGRRAGEGLAVRTSAIEAIAVLAHNVAEKNAPQKLANPQLDAALRELAHDETPEVRSSTAFAIGASGREELLGLLVEMLHDVRADVRFNAATGLARYGRVEAVPYLEDMFDPESSSPQQLVPEGANPSSLAMMRAAIMLNGLQAVAQFAAQNPSANLDPLITAIERLAESDEVERQVRVQSKQLLKKLRPPT